MKSKFIEIKKLPVLLSLIVTITIIYFSRTLLNSTNISPKQSKFSSNEPALRIDANDILVRGAMRASDLQLIRKKIGQQGSYVGTVSSIYIPPSGSITVINFSNNYKEAMCAIVRSSNYSKFTSLESLKGRKVLVSGEYESHENSKGESILEIEISDSSQIKLVS